MSIQAIKRARKEALRLIKDQGYNVKYLRREEGGAGGEVHYPSKEVRFFNLNHTNQQEQLMIIAHELCHCLQVEIHSYVKRYWALGSVEGSLEMDLQYENEAEQFALFFCLYLGVDVSNSGMYDPRETVFYRGYGETEKEREEMLIQWIEGFFLKLGLDIKS